MIHEHERRTVLEEAEFLISYGFKLEKTNEYFIDYSNEEYRISVYFGRFNDPYDVSIKYLKNNKSFSIGWIAVVRDNVQFSSDDKLGNILKRLSYIKDNYERITNLDFCIESEKMIRPYLINKGVRVSDYNPDEQ